MPLEKMRLRRIEAETHLLARLEVCHLGGGKSEDCFAGCKKFDYRLGTKPLDQRDLSGDRPVGVENKMLRANPQPCLVSPHLVVPVGLGL